MITHYDRLAPVMKDPQHRILNGKRVWSLILLGYCNAQSDQMRHVRAANLEQNLRICSLQEQLSQQEPRKELFLPEEVLYVRFSTHYIRILDE